MSESQLHATYRVGSQVKSGEGKLRKKLRNLTRLRKQTWKIKEKQGCDKSQNISPEKEGKWVL